MRESVVTSFEKTIKVIKSCKTYKQTISADNMINNFINMYDNLGIQVYLSTLNTNLWLQQQIIINKH